MKPETIKSFTSALETLLLEAFSDAPASAPSVNPFDLPNKNIIPHAIFIDDKGNATYQKQPLTPAQRDWLYYTMNNRMPGKMVWDPIPTTAEVTALFKAAFPDAV